jgi:O-antigen/teichoic acid export membrane protein
VISFVALASGIIFNMIFLPQLGIWSVCLSLYVIRIFQMLTALFFIKRYKTEYATFTKESRLFILSFIMILVYNILLYFNLRFDFANIYIINLFPVAFLTVTSILLINQFRQYQLIRMIGIKNN